MAFNGASVAVLLPAYNEEKQIGVVLKGVPSYVDEVLVVDDGSTDGTADVVRSAAQEDHRINLVRFEDNRGVGAAISAGYIWARGRRFDVTVTLDADGQMSWEDMEHLIRPIADNRADLTKGNRLLSPDDWSRIPKLRLLGNAALSLLTKIASGYWSVADSQSGYVACSRYALDNIEWEKLYPSYGRPNDILIRANVANCRVADVPIRPVYGIGEKSSMSVLKATFGISFLLFRRFWWRLSYKYVLRDFHPLVFFYLLAVFAFVANIAIGVHIGTTWAETGRIPQIAALTGAFLTVTFLNSLFFAFWMDMQVNAPLAVRLSEYFEIRTEIAEGGPHTGLTEGLIEERPPPDYPRDAPG
jgi:glycosyltransferase involved in cell wall biosynthesis